MPAFGRLSACEVIYIKINYRFKNEKLLKTALTHISLAKEAGIESNQRLEFLGDSILSYVIASKLYETYPKCSEGNLTEMRAFLVCEKTLAQLADKMNLGSGIMFSKTEIMTDGKHKNSILADTFEAVLGAIYLDSDIETAGKWILEVFGSRIYNIDMTEVISYKSALQNYIQAKYHDRINITYRLVEKKGPDHKPTFRVEALAGDRVLGWGTGTSLKLAEKQAAKEAYFMLTEKDEENGGK